MARCATDNNMRNKKNSITHIPAEQSANKTYTSNHAEDTTNNLIIKDTPDKNFVVTSSRNKERNSVLSNPPTGVVNLPLSVNEDL